MAFLMQADNWLRTKVTDLLAGSVLILGLALSLYASSYEIKPTSGCNCSMTGENLVAILYGGSSFLQEEFITVKSDDIMVALKCYL